MPAELSPTMTVGQFENGYWYVGELRDFAKSIGVPGAARLRKDELEEAIVTFLRTGRVARPSTRARPRTGQKDLDRGLTLALPIEHYTSNRETKDFIVEQARRIAPDVRARSGVWYRLNRWREEQLTNGRRPTYGDLVEQYIRLNRAERFEKVAHGRYVNFVSDFLASEQDATREQAIAAWAELKRLDVPKDYASWVAARTR